MAWPPTYVFPLVFQERDGNMSTMMAYRKVDDATAALQDAVNARMALMISNGMDAADLTVDFEADNTWGFIRQRDVGVVFTAMCGNCELQ